MHINTKTNSLDVGRFKSEWILKQRELTLTPWQKANCTNNRFENLSNSFGDNTFLRSRVSHVFLRDNKDKKLSVRVTSTDWSVDNRVEWWFLDFNLREGWKIFPKAAKFSVTGNMMKCSHSPRTPSFFLTLLFSPHLHYSFKLLKLNWWRG